MVDRFSHRFLSRLAPFTRDFIVVGLLLGAIWICYAPSLAYPFVQQDSADLVFAVKQPLSVLLTGSTHHPYYRPLFFVPWKFILNSWESNSATAFHFYLIGTHLLNAVMLYALIRDLFRQRAIGLAAGLLFITYPVSYQALLWAIGQQPPSLTFVLVSVLLYARARLKDKGWPQHVIAALCLPGGILLHESAFIGVGMVILVELYLLISRRRTRISAWPLLYVATTAAVYGLYQLATTARPVAISFDPLTTLYLLQSLFYPASMLLARACHASGCDSVAWLWPLAVIMLLGLLVLWRSGKTLLLGLFGLALFAVGAAPVWLRLDYTFYLQYGARVMYHASPGAAVVFAALLSTAVSAWQRAARLLLVVLILVQSGLFLLGRQTLSSVAFDLLDQANHALLAPHNGQRLFINTIDLFGFKEHEFPLGWFGVFAGPWHNRVGATPNVKPYDADWAIDPTSAQDVLARSSLELTLHDVERSPAEFQESFKTVHEVYRVEALDKGFHLFRIAEIEHNMPAPSSFMAEWSQAVRLDNASIDVEAGVPVLNLEWWIGGPLGPDQTVFVHVRNVTGEVVAQFDAAPIDGLAPLGTWVSGDLIRERRPLLLPSNLAQGQYSIAVGLYNWQSLERMLPDQTNVSAAQDGVLVVGGFDYPLDSNQAP